MRHLCSCRNEEKLMNYNNRIINKEKYYHNIFIKLNYIEWKQRDTSWRMEESWSMQYMSQYWKTEQLQLRLSTSIISRTYFNIRISNWAINGQVPRYSISRKMLFLTYSWTQPNMVKQISSNVIIVQWVHNLARRTQLDNGIVPHVNEFDCIERIYICLF